MSDDNHLGLHFSHRQNSVITACVTGVVLLGGIVALAWTLGTLFGFLGRHSTVLLPPVVGIVLAMVAKPIQNMMEQVFRNRRYLAVTATTVIVFVPVLAFFWFCGKLLITQGVRFIDALPALCARIARAAAEHLPTVKAFLDRHGAGYLLDAEKVGGLLQTYLPKLIIPAGGTAISVGSHIVGATVRFLGWIVLPVYTAFFLATRPLGGDDIRKLLSFAPPRIRENAAFLVDQFLGIVVTFFRGQMVVVLVQGVLYGIGFQLSGLPYGFFIGVVLGLLNIVPYLGNILGLGVTLPLAWFGPDGSLGRLGWVLGVFIAVHTLDTYFITPRVMGSRTGLSSFGVIFSIFFWGSVIGGVLGMLLAVPLSAFVVVFWRLLVRDYIGPLLNADEPAERGRPQGRKGAKSPGAAKPQSH